MPIAGQIYWLCPLSRAMRLSALAASLLLSSISIQAYADG